MLLVVVSATFNVRSPASLRKPGGYNHTRLGPTGAFQGLLTYAGPACDTKSVLVLVDGGECARVAASRGAVVVTDHLVFVDAPTVVLDASDAAMLRNYVDEIVAELGEPTLAPTPRRLESSKKKADRVAKVGVVVVVVFICVAVLVACHIDNRRKRHRVHHRRYFSAHVTEPGDVELAEQHIMTDEIV